VQEPWAAFGELAGGVKSLHIVINKEYIEDLHRHTVENIDFISTAVNANVRSKELVSVLEEKLNDIMHYLNKVYNHELMQLKRQSEMYYMKWLTLKDTDKDSATDAFLEYLNLEHKIYDIEIPF
jgi:hypothetical protein